MRRTHGIWSFQVVTTTTHTVRGQYINSMDALFRSRNLWTGGENLMANTSTDSGDPRNNVERVDYVFDAFEANARQGFSVFDRGRNTAGANGPFKVVAITGYDAQGRPTFLNSNVVTVGNNLYGGGNLVASNRYDVFQGTAGSGLDTLFNVNIGPQGMSGAYIPVTDLVTAGTIVYGYAVLPNDVTATGANLTDWTNSAYYSTTSNMSNDLDLVASGATYFTEDSLAIGWVTPEVNLGAIHINGNFASKQATVDNIADSTADKLNAAVAGNSAGINTAGSVSVSNLTPDGTPVAAITIDIDAVAVAGAVSGTVTTDFVSNGSSLPTQDVGFGTTKVTGMIYSGQSEWIKTSGGSWGGGDPQLVTTHDEWGANEGAPGVWLGAVNGNFDNVDTATFGNNITTPTATVTVDSVVSVKSITFNNTENESYTIAPSATPGTGSLALKSNTGTAYLNDQAGNHTITAPITMQSNVSSTVASGSVLTVTQLLTGTGGTQTLTKTGGGTLYFTGTGASASNAAMTTVYQGTLRVDGTLNSPTLVTKDSGGAGTLTGVNGTIGGPVELANGGTISPGNGEVTRSSRLTVNSLLLDSGGNYHFDISAMTEPTLANKGYQSSAGANYDTITSAGLLDLKGIHRRRRRLQPSGGLPLCRRFYLHQGLPLGTRYIRAKHRVADRCHRCELPVHNRSASLQCLQPRVLVGQLWQPGLL